MKAGDFLVIKGHSDNLVEDVIALGEHSDFVHVEAATGFDTFLNPVWPYILEQQGELATSVPNQYLIEPDLTIGEQDKITRELRKFIGKHYGVAAFIWAGLCVLFPLLRYLHDPVKSAGYVCSTAVAWAYFNAGCYEKLRVGNQSPESVSPADLARAWGLW